MSTKGNKLKTTNRKTIQIILIFLGFMLIAITYFIYPRLTQQTIQEKVTIDESVETEETTTFTNVEYKGITSDGSPYIVSSEYENIFDNSIIFSFLS